MAVRVASVPAGHPYPQAIVARPGETSADQELEILADPIVDPDEPARWWPHRALEPAFWTDRPADVLHIHFGFEHLSLEQTHELAATLQRLSVPLVLTVHDLDNPHVESQTTYHQQLGILIAQADHLITLTPASAALIDDRYGRKAHVLPHPPIVGRREVLPSYPLTDVGVFLKSGRANVVKDPEFYRELGADRVFAHADSAQMAALATDVHEPMDDEQLFSAIASHRVVVLPYVRGTHSGWLQMCRELGVSVAAPDCGCYWDQADVPEAVEIYRAGDGQDAARACARLLERGQFAYHSPRISHRDVVDFHRNLYVQLGSKGKSAR
ncbi:glycosyltransferase [Corynebacterium tapiri]|uniref:Glycosyltransferase family 4 protein n=1 Tax=Corynebacterium tapiri TaxID=1448266 RepID=A0A5C4U694_9CORY|nr:glycosyltransferase [Corynebacterium tapiri]TNL99768.1 glycosyltransferase family 4 protein [Corynebacterium tapiri]